MPAILLALLALASDAGVESPARIRASQETGPGDQLRLSAPVTLSSLVEAGRERQVTVRPDQEGTGLSIASPAAHWRTRTWESLRLVPLSPWPHDVPLYRATPPPLA